MLIDWFTVGAQTLNFLILVWLMQRFLYKPILRAIDARELRIAQGFAEADLKKAEAQKELDGFRSRNEAFDRQRAVLVSQMTEEVSAERSRLLDAARKAADDMSAKRMETLRSEAHHLNETISRRAQQEVFDIVRKTLADLATTSLEGQMVDVFVRQLQSLSAQEKEGLKAPVTAQAGPVVVRSAFELPAAQRGLIEDVIKEVIDAEASTRFETVPDFVSGIDLTANGRKISWNIAAYLQSLEKGVCDLLNEDGLTNDMAEPQPVASGPGTANS